tara:strand:- start:1671 stop:2024 length:354 start_codon:yes stop_codon:yes gene_type:complete
MSTPASKDLKFYSGDDQVIQFVAKDSSKQIIDLTGATAKMQLKVKRDDVGYVMEQVGVVVGVEGKVTITFTPAEVDSLGSSQGDTKSYLYDIQLTLIDTTVVTVLAGRVSVVYGVTI